MGSRRGVRGAFYSSFFFRSHFQFFFHLSFRFTLGVSVSFYFRFFVGFTLRFSFLGFSFLLIIILLMAAVSTMALQVLRPPYTLPVDAAQVTKDIEVLHAAGTAQAGTDEVRLCVFRMSCLFFGCVLLVWVFGLYYAHTPTFTPSVNHALNIGQESTHAYDLRISGMIAVVKGVDWNSEADHSHVRCESVWGTVDLRCGIRRVG